MFRSTIGQTETHSIDGSCHIAHPAEGQWVVVWYNVKLEPVHTTRKLARTHIRALKGPYAPRDP